MEELERMLQSVNGTEVETKHPVDGEPIKGSYGKEVRRPYTGLTLVNQSPYKGGTSIKYWM